MRKFTLLLTLLLAFMTTAIAQIDTSKEYRVKHTTTGKVMNASNYDAHPTGPLGGVNFVEEAESDDQVFLFEADGTGYKLKTKSGKYIYCQAWNVDALDQASTLTFSNNGDGTYKIGCDKGYFKVENVTGSPVVKENGAEVTKEQVSGYFPFCDAGYTAAANFELVEVEAGTPEVPEVPEVGGEDEATLAAIEKAEGVLAKTGVGYPAAESASRAALVAAVEEAKAAPTTENGTKVNAALVAYMAETNVTLPESGKYYTFTMVAKNGNKFYLNYTGADVAMTAVTGEALPESAKFLATANGDGTYTFQTNDGNYLVYHSKYAGVNWLEGNGSTTGFQAEKDDMTNITLAKLSKGNNVAATTEQVFGLVSWYGKRGYNTSKNADEMGFMVLKTDGSDYDGAGAPFWNDNYSSAFLVEETEVAAVEPVLPLELVSVSPEDNANLSAFDKVVLTFNKPVTVVESDETGAILMFNGMPAMQLWTDLSEDGKSVAMHAGTPIDMVGTYGVYVMPGTFVDADGNLSEEMMFNYTVAGAADGFTYTYAAPTTDKVQSSLKNITLGFASAVATVKTDALNVVDGEGNVVTTATVAADDMDDQAVVVTLAEEVVYTGTYSLTVPAQFVTSALGTYNPEFTLTYTVEGLEKPSAVDYTPRHTGAKSRSDRNMTSVKVGEQEYTLTAEEQALCYIDATEKVTFKIEAGAEVALEANTVASWIHNAVFVDTDANGFVGAIEEGSEWEPAGDLVAYSFYNNGGASDENGWNSKGTAISGDDRNRPALPAFTAPTTPGTYRMRFTQDWCSIDPAGDNDGKFKDFMDNGGQIIDVLLEVVEVTTPATPLELVSVDPADGAELESVSKFTFTFNKPVTLGAEGGVVLYVNGSPVGQLEGFVSEEDAKVVTFVTEKEISNSGKYMLYVAPATFVDADGNTNEEMMLNYQVKAAVNSFTYAYVTPAQHQVQKSLKVLTIGFIGEVQDVVSSKSINVVDAEGKTVTTAKLDLDDYDWNAVIVTFKDEITAPGQYSITIPEEYVFSWEQTYNPEFTLTFTIEGEEPVEPYNTFVPTKITPAEGLVESLKEIVLEFGPNDYPGTNGLDMNSTFNLTNAAGDVVATGKLSYSGYTAAAVTLDKEIVEPGVYTIIIPEGSIWNSKVNGTADKGVSNGARCNPTLELTYEIKAATSVVAVDPACGHYEVMPATIKVTFSQEISAITFSRIGTDVKGEAYTLQATDMNINGKELTFTVPAEYVTEARKMLIMLAVVDANGNSVSYASNKETEIEGYVMLEYTADAITGINGISVEQLNDVYTLDGRKVVLTPGQKIKKGLYIVGGKKVYVK